LPLMFMAIWQSPRRGFGLGGFVNAKVRAPRFDGLTTLQAGWLNEKERSAGLMRMWGPRMAIRGLF
jgi:hypothetical protein